MRRETQIGGIRAVTVCCEGLGSDGPYGAKGIDVGSLINSREDIIPESKAPKINKKTQGCLSCVPNPSGATALAVTPQCYPYSTESVEKTWGRATVTFFRDWRW
jgi:hypothetical protein